MRKLALEYVTGYLESGNSRLAEYRDAERPTFVAQEFAAMVNRMPPLTSYLTDLKGYLLNYPKVTLPTRATRLLRNATRDLPAVETGAVRHARVPRGSNKTRRSDPVLVVVSRPVLRT